MIAPRKNDKVDGHLIGRGRRVSLTFRQALFPGDIPGNRLCSSEIEEEHVFKVYDSIALHWHHTRGKRKVHWHRVKAFIETIEAGSLLADIGSGDGKYFGLSPAVYSLGCDRSMKLLEVSRDLRYETFCCDAVKLPLRSDVFDAVLCIAVLHHIATIDRRVSVIRELLRICRLGGRVMLQAWALEQEGHSKKKFEEQDVLVPWKLQVFSSRNTHINTLVNDFIKRHFQLESSGSTGSSSIESVPEIAEETGELVYQRYCHVYKEGELEDLCSGIPGCRVVDSGFDKGNWFVLFEKSLDSRLSILSGTGPTSEIPAPHTRNLKY